MIIDDENSTSNQDLWDFTLEALGCEEYSNFANLLDVNSTQTTSSSNEDRCLIKKKKSYRSKESLDRWNRSRRAHPFPRILKRDIRRNYPLQFLNAINSGDESFYFRYFQKYFTSECILTSSKGQYGEENFPAKGPKELLKLFQYCFETMPDFTITLNQSRICINPQTNESKILLFVNYSGTVIKCQPKDYPLLTQHIQQKLQIENQPSDSYDESLIKLAEIHLEDDIRSATTLETCLLPLPQPIKSSVNAQITFSLNENFYITRFDSYLIETSFLLEPIQL